MSVIVSWWHGVIPHVFFECETRHNIGRGKLFLNERSNKEY